MHKKDNKIQCPECGTSIDVSDVLRHQLEDELRKEYAAKVSSEKEKYDKQLAAVNKRETDLNKRQEKMDDTINEAVCERLAAQKPDIEKKLRKQIAEEKSDEVKEYQQQIAELTETVRTKNKLEAELAKEKREKSLLESKIKAEAEQQYSAKLAEDTEKIKEEVEKSFEFKFSAKDSVIKQLQEQLAIAQRKASQGSVQLQGEVQELAIEEYLKKSFPFDHIEEIKKGVRGADCLQTVNTRMQANCGSVYYESKRTKDFQPSWIEKFKTDMRENGAKFGVLVTETMPKDVTRMTKIDGVWVCSFEEFKALCHVLRDTLIAISEITVSQDNKGEKMVMLYDFLTGQEFRNNVEAIVEGFIEMKADLNGEKRAMFGIWKKREKQIEKVTLNTTRMYAAIKGIAGNAIGSIKALELPQVEEETEAIEEATP